MRENTNNEEEDDEPNDDIHIEGERFIEDVGPLQNVEATTDQQNDSPTYTPYATEYDEEQTSNLPPITEEEPLTRGLEEDKESDEMYKDNHNNEERNRPEKENTEEDDKNEDKEVDTYNDRIITGSKSIRFNRTCHIKKRWDHKRKSCYK